MFVSFDGVDGVGKTTQMRRFCQWLGQQGRRVVTCRDPGSTPLGEEVRRLVLGDHAIGIGRRSEMLLYMAARAQLVEQVIRPALEAGETVVSDRYLLANIVYQGYAGGLDVEEVRQVGQIATAGLMPDLILLLDMPAQQALQRITRPADRMESQGLEYLQKVRDGFLAEAQRLGDRVVQINADQDPDQVFREIVDATTPLLAKSANTDADSQKSSPTGNRPGQANTEPSHDQ